MNRFVAIFACLVATTTWAQEQEPNNDRASANAISHGQVIRGSITAGDEDYYVVTLSGVATIEAKKPSENIAAVSPRLQPNSSSIGG